MAIVGLTGRDLVGDWLHHAIGGYSVIVWMMLLMLGASLWHSRKPASA